MPQHPLDTRPRPGSECLAAAALLSWAECSGVSWYRPKFVICQAKEKAKYRLHPTESRGRARGRLRFITPGVVLAVPGSSIPPCPLHRRLGDFMPPTWPGRTCTPPGSTTNAPSPSPCTGTCSSTSLFHCLPCDATVSIFIFLIWIYSFVSFIYFLG